VPRQRQAVFPRHVHVHQGEIDAARRGARRAALALSAASVA
jgi:hypothetical protein